MCGTIMLKPDIQSIPVFKWHAQAALQFPDVFWLLSLVD
jgi:hypothetical protein